MSKGSRSGKPSVKKPGAAASIEHRFTQFEISTSPLPSPNILARYEQLVPGSASRFMDMLEEQHSHRIRLETSVVSSNIRSQTRGSWMGFCVAMSGIAGALALLAMGRTMEGAALAVLDIGGLAGVFVWGRSRQHSERREKLIRPGNPYPRG